jgi:hypothetical protein
MSDVLKFLAEISKMLPHLDQPLNIYQLKRKFGLSLRQSKQLLSEYIIQNEDDLVCHFSATIRKADSVSKMLIPNYSIMLDEALEGDLLDFYPYCISLRSKFNGINDLAVLSHDNEVITNIKITKTDVVMRINTMSIGKKTEPVKQSKNIIKEDDEEYFYEEMDVVPSNIVVDKPLKRKASDTSDTLVKMKKESKERIMSPKVEIKTSESNKLETKPQVKPVVTNNFDTRSADDENSNLEIRKIKKIRKVKKTKTYKDEKGYLYTKDEWEDEEYWSDDKPVKQIAPKINYNHDKTKKKPAAGKKAPSQSSIQSFFGK